MEIELALVEHSYDEQHRPVKPNMMSKSSDRQNTFDDKKIWKKSTLAYDISKSWYSFFLKFNNINLYSIYH
jgi:hypothetical protein